MEEKSRFDDMKPKQLRDDIQARIASGDDGTLDAEASSDEATFGTLML